MFLTFFYLNCSFKAAEEKEHLHGFLMSANETNHVYKAFIRLGISLSVSHIKLRNTNSISKMQNLVYTFKNAIIFRSNDCWKTFVFQYIQYKRIALIFKW